MFQAEAQNKAHSLTIWKSNKEYREVNKGKI